VNGPIVLIVEDDFLIRMNAAGMIEDAGFEVVEAASADEAIVILEARLDIRVVFTDIQMPGSMDGVKLARFVRGADQNRRDLWLRQRWERRLAGRRALSAKALPLGANCCDASRIDGRRVSRL
jgi:CheY-like chemotaxis protein